MRRSTLFAIPLVFIVSCGDDEEPSGQKSNQGGSAGASGTGGAAGMNTGGSSGTGGRGGGGTSLRRAVSDRIGV